jgi:hypothetical protein
MSDFWEKREVQEWLENAANDMFPKMKDSACSIAIFSGKVDPKFALEIGAAILFDKPIVLLVTKDEQLSPSLERAAAAIVRGGMDEPGTVERLHAAIEKVLPHKV